MDNHQTIERYAAVFRSAIEEVANDLSEIRGFPDRCCRYTSMMLGVYLDEVDCPGFKLMVDPNGDSHAWLEREGLIVDITADQFCDYCHTVAPVVVTTNHDWHDRYFSSADASEYDRDGIRTGAGNNPLHGDYKKVRARIRAR